MNKAEENFFVMGKALDIAKFWTSELLIDMHPSTCKYILSYYEKMYQLRSSGSTSTRRYRILAAMRARGGLTKSYLEGVGNLLGTNRYTVTITEGTGALPFILHAYSKLTHPAGPATLLPNPMRSTTASNTCYTLTATVTGVQYDEELETLFNRLKPAWTNFLYEYFL